MNRSMHRRMVAVVMLLALTGLAWSGSKLHGTYQNENGSIVVELRSSGKARVTLMGESADCTYDVNGDKVKVKCEGEDMELTVLDDGGLAGGGLIGTLRKRS